jgi:hypothetical protein
VERRSGNTLKRTFYNLLHAGLLDLPFKEMVKRMLQLQVISSSGIILAIWAGEVYDLPHLIFATPPREMNLYAPVISTAWVLLVLALALAATRSLIKRVRYLEGFLRVCSFCKKINIGAVGEERWVSFEEYFHKHSEARMTHSLCAPCAKQHYGYEVKAGSA